ncbi:MAG: guanylate kinase [Hyphomonadaceae bacterium]|nr:guanylate kinase [Hyphomonadaceae bacterium]
MRITRRGLLLVLSSPSGAGKTTLARRLLDAEPGIHMSVSVTTRKPRPGEVEGVDYFFVDKREFERLKARRKLLEWAEVFGQLYATPKTPVVDALQSGNDVLFDVDWQGARQIKKRLPRDVVRVFILPPDGKTLERRLRARNQDSEAAVVHRMAKAAAEIEHWDEYDYVVVNVDVEKCLAELRSILAAERLKRERQSGLAGFVGEMLDDL